MHQSTTATATALYLNHWDTFLFRYLNFWDFQMNMFSNHWFQKFIERIKKHELKVVNEVDSQSCFSLSTSLVNHSFVWLLVYHHCFWYLIFSCCCDLYAVINIQHMQLEKNGLKIRKMRDEGVVKTSKNSSSLRRESSSECTREASCSLIFLLLVSQKLWIFQGKCGPAALIWVIGFENNMLCFYWCIIDSSACSL